MKKRNKALLVFALILFMLLIRMIGEIGEEQTPEDRFRVNRVIDGDTIELSGGEKVRLIGIDSPERGKPFYDSAGAVLGSLVANKKIEIKYSNRRRDKYGRLLGYIYIDSTFINRELVRLGLANVYRFSDSKNDYEVISLLIPAQDSAMDDDIGIWSVPRVQEDRYFVSKGSLRFHRPSCRHLSSPDPNKYIQFRSRRSAFREGYSPCRTCQP